jgi:hypothetical protein
MNGIKWGKLIGAKIRPLHDGRFEMKNIGLNISAVLSVYCNILKEQISWWDIIAENWFYFWIKF